MIAAAAVDPMLRVFISGLVVFVTNNPLKPADLQTILLNAADTPVATDGCPVPRHRPLLLHNQTCQYPCKPERGLCACPLDRSLVRFWSVDKINGARVLLGSGNPLGDFASLDQCVARARGGILKRMKVGSVKRIRPDCRIPGGRIPPPGEAIPVCPLVAAQVDFVPDDFYACELMSVEHASGSVMGDVCSEDAMMEGTEFGFSPLSKYSRTWYRQPLATREVLKRAVPDLAVLVVEVRSFDGTFDYEVRLKPVACGACWSTTSLCADLAIVNQPEPSQLKINDYERCGELHVDREFELFEDLLAESGEIESRRVPQASMAGQPFAEKRSPWCESNLNYQLDRWFRTGGERKQCPPLSVAGGE